jgi:hypothetical protein
VGRGSAPHLPPEAECLTNLALAKLFEQLLRFDFALDPLAAVPVAAAQRWVASASSFCGLASSYIRADLIPIMNKLKPHCAVESSSTPTWCHIKALVSAFMTIAAAAGVFPGVLEE